MRNFFKDENNNVFEYDDKQVSQGYGKDLTPITEEEMLAITNQPKTEEQILSEKIAGAKRYLSDTGWIWEKYNRNVLVLKDLTEEEFKIKYDDIILKQEECRILINELGL